MSCSTWARSSRAVSSSTREAVPVQAVVESVYSMIEPQMRSRDLLLQVEAPDPRLHFYADRDRVEQDSCSMFSPTPSSSHLPAAR